MLPGGSVWREGPLGGFGGRVPSGRRQLDGVPSLEELAAAQSRGEWSRGHCLLISGHVWMPIGSEFTRVAPLMFRDVGFNFTVCQARLLAVRGPQPCHSLFHSTAARLINGRHTPQISLSQTALMHVLRACHSLVSSPTSFPWEWRNSITCFFLYLNFPAYQLASAFSLATPCQGQVSWRRRRLTNRLLGLS